jgi:hypothetical protein
MALTSMLFDWDWPRTERSFKRALELAPGYLQAGTWYALFYLGFITRRWDEAIERLRAVQRAEPLSAYAAACAAYGLADCGRGAEALEMSTLACRLDSTSYLSLWTHQLALFVSGDYAASIEASDRALAISGRLQGSLVVLASTLAASGDLAGARAVRSELDARAAREPISLASRAIAAAAVGDDEAAVTLAQEALARRDPILVVFGQAFFARALHAIPAYRNLLAATGVTIHRWD